VAAETKEKQADIAKMSFEEAVGELETIVKKLEVGESGLDNAITDYERGMALKAHCEKKLADAKMKVEKIVQTTGGDLGSETFDPQG